MAAKQVVLFKLLGHNHHDKIGFSHLACFAYKHELSIAASILATGILDLFIFK